MPSTKQQILNEIKTHIRNNGGEYRDWHVDICSIAYLELLSQAKAKHLFISRQAFSSYVAAEVQDYFSRVGTNGNIGTDTGNSDIVYVYRKSVIAKEETSQANDVSSERTR